jgi:hypothetical protein
LVDPAVGEWFGWPAVADLGGGGGVAGGGAGEVGGEANGSITGNFHIWLIIKLMMKGYFKICRIAQANRPV